MRAAIAAVETAARQYLRGRRIVLVVGGESRTRRVAGLLTELGATVIYSVVQSELGGGNAQAHAVRVVGNQCGVPTADVESLRTLLDSEEEDLRRTLDAIDSDGVAEVVMGYGWRRLRY